MPIDQPIHRRFGDSIFATAHDSGLWMWASGRIFPTLTQPAPPDGALFLRTDLDAWYSWDEGTRTWTIVGGAMGAPATAEYLVGVADAGLSAERVVTDTASVIWDLSTPGQAKANAIAAAAPDSDARFLALAAM